MVTTTFGGGQIRGVKPLLRPIVLVTALASLGCPSSPSPESPASEAAKTEAPASAEARAPMPQRLPDRFDWRFRCGDETIEVEWTDERVLLSVQGEELALRRDRSASGARFEALNAPNTTFWSKGDRATVVVQGRELPECRLLEPADPIVTATGNEPGWRVEIGTSTITLETNYGSTLREIPRPRAESIPNGLRFRATHEGTDLVFTVRDVLCHDDMTGIPHPKQVEVRVGDEQLRGCGGEPRSLLSGETWQVTRVGERTVPAEVDVTLEFSEEDRAGGSGGCNRYTTRFELTPEILRFEDIASTKRACPTPAMEIESAFFEALRETDHFDMTDDGRLLLGGSEGGIEAVRAD